MLTWSSWKFSSTATMERVNDVLLKQGGLDRFKGFARPNTTPTPDEIFDRFLHDLTHSELKVILYIIRRTYGFRKSSDRISLKQITDGLVTRGGKRLDHGTGLSRRGAISAVQSLEKKGLITVKRVRSEDGYNSVNVYGLRFRRG